MSIIKNSFIDLVVFVNEKVNHCNVSNLSQLSHHCTVTLITSRADSSAHICSCVRQVLEHTGKLFSIITIANYFQMINFICIVFVTK